VWTRYREIARRYDRLPLRQERRSIAKAQRGSTKSAEEIVMRHVGFVMYRAETRPVRVIRLETGGEDTGRTCISA